MEPAQQATPSVVALPRVRGNLAAAIERQRRGEGGAALALIERHIAEQPHDLEGWLALAQAQRRCGHADAALLSLQRALRLAPRDAVVWSNLGDTWLALGHGEQALRAHRQAVELAPLRIDLCLHCVVALRRLQRFAEAEGLLDQCLEREPGREDLRHERALLCLYTGRWRAAWPDYGVRADLPPDRVPGVPAPRWAGERIGARHLLLVAGTDPGECLWAARFVPLLARRGAMLSLVVDQALHCLLAALPVQLLAPGDARLAREVFDYLSPLAHLPWLVDPRGVTIPEPVTLCTGTVAPPPALGGAGEDEVAYSLRVGVAWPPPGNSARAHGPGPGAERFAALATLPGVRVVSLQLRPCYGESPEPGAACGVDPATLAAVIDTLDVVVTADDRVAHLAGSLGRPVLNLLPFTPYWIWGVRGDATPWYPSMRLLRQRTPGDWDTVFEELLALVRGWARVRQREAKRAARARAREARGTWF